jgi:hypothetical protein
MPLLSAVKMAGAAGATGTLTTFEPRPRYFTLIEALAKREISNGTTAITFVLATERTGAGNPFTNT